MKNNLFRLLLLLFTVNLTAQTDQVSVVSNEEGTKLVVNGEDFMINGMNWDYIPIGTNTVNANFWKKSDDVIKAGLDHEMALLKNMGVNVIRQYTGVPAKWIRYIYENYGIYTMLNHSFGRYGLTLNGVWTPVTIYDDPTTREFLLAEMRELVEGYKNTPGLLLYLLGNENNYGLFWAGAETEDFPDDEGRIAFIGESRGRPMYRLMNEAAKMMKEMDASHPVAICNGDVLFIDIVAEECKDVDIYGTNTYRGVSFGDMFQVVKDKLDKPIMFTEFGADAFSAIENKEDQYSQAYYMVGNWKEIYENAAGVGKVGNSIGGFTFQFSDGWWKFGFDDRKNADVHDNNASWSNGGYARDLPGEGKNNMNEEWFGICAKGATNPRGLYELYPRAAYYALKEAHQLNPYDQGVDQAFVQNYFDNIQLMDAVLKARGDKAALTGEQSNLLRISNLQAKFSTFSTGGSLITTPDNADPDDPNTFPNQLGFDHMQSYFIGVEGNPAPNMRAEVNVNVVGNVAQNPINEIFYENNSRPLEVNTDQGNVLVQDVNRIRVYNAEFEWKAKQFDIRGFYRTGHYHWGYEGDFFGLYPEANYGPNLDIYNGEILGTEVDGKGALKGFKAAIGPQLWWGANPTMLFKYKTHVGKFDVTGIYHRDFETDITFDENGRRILDVNQVRSGVIPPWPTERATLAIEREFGKFGVHLGGIWAGNPLNGSTFQDVRGTSGNYIVYEDKVQASDNWGGKVKLTYEGGKFNWYGQAAAMGLVANGGADQTLTFTGWKLRDTGSGNQVNFLSGFTYATGNFQIAPNFLWQKPLVDPIPNDVTAPGRLRNIIDDPFSVRGNRETTAGEILFTFDPTPGTWMYEWDNDRAEDAKFAMNLGFVYRHLPTTQDAHIGFLADRTFFAFPNSAPAEDLWEVHSRMVSKISSDLGIIGNFYYGNGQGNGDSERLIKRFGGDVRMIYKNFKLRYEQKINDWGPFDYHRDFNLTYPVQLMLDISTTLGKPDWFILPSTQVGIRGTWRSLNEFSPRYLPNVAAEFSNEPIISPVGFDDGSEWEIMTYIHINIGK
ncbi:MULTISPECIES: glycoside hydrolase family 2 TIM barrel-domain containing protein [Flavobacteriaceae]|uniref:glycoside hydrolase family 2 TIM barrel-domain containing protein n=1 Tax=Flavobacteriaceae TaxID=49546 RepID=UPI001491D452|nr:MULTISPECIES: glycoside hydrolase family 2 TIM barrel-domain containing protein [Allomuricauda]MDC6367526.1 glycoside hydrolase family 2 TIM barrel-domain containing protein [Muricauda sp. AC10]